VAKRDMISEDVIKESEEIQSQKMNEDTQEERKTIDMEVNKVDQPRMDPSGEDENTANFGALVSV